MWSRNLLYLTIGLAVAAVTLMVSWRFGFVFFFLPLLFFWSWSSRGRRLSDPERDFARSEPAEDDPRKGSGNRERPSDRRDEPFDPDATRGVDGEGI
jgi:hypothetical protein